MRASFAADVPYCTARAAWILPRKRRSVVIFRRTKAAAPQGSVKLDKNDAAKCRGGGLVPFSGRSTASSGAASFGGRRSPLVTPAGAHFDEG
jgi:hypothetical protein